MQRYISVENNAGGRICSLNRIYDRLLGIQEVRERLVRCSSFRYTCYLYTHYATIVKVQLDRSLCDFPFTFTSKLLLLPLNFTSLLTSSSINANPSATGKELLSVSRMEYKGTVAGDSDAM